MKLKGFHQAFKIPGGLQGVGLQIEVQFPLRLRIDLGDAAIEVFMGHGYDSGKKIAEIIGQIRIDPLHQSALAEA